MGHSAPAPAPWEQQPGEPDEAYARFNLYLSLGPGRSFRAAYELHLRRSDDAADDAAPEPPPRGKAGGKRPPGAPGQWTRDSAAWNWCERARAWDVHALATFGHELAVKWVGSLGQLATIMAERLAECRATGKKPTEPLMIFDRLAQYVTPDVLRAIQASQPAAAPPRGGDSPPAGGRSADE